MEFIMELSNSTVSVLKNFAQINPNLTVTKGKMIKTIAETKNIFAIATLKDEFPSSFGIYDLSEFLGVLGLIENPKLLPEAGFATIVDQTGRSKIKYYFTDPEMLTALPGSVKFPDSDVKMKLDRATLSKIKSAASALGHSHLAIEPSDGAIALTVFDPDSKTSNTFSTVVPGEYVEDAKFKFVLSIDSLKRLISTDGDFDVNLSSKLITKFTLTGNDEISIDYFIAPEKTSTYGV
jgi:hypothetical protein